MYNIVEIESWKQIDGKSRAKLKRVKEISSKLFTYMFYEQRPNVKYCGRHEPTLFLLN